MYGICICHKAYQQNTLEELYSEAFYCLWYFRCSHSRWTIYCVTFLEKLQESSWWNTRCHPTLVSSTVKQTSNAGFCDLQWRSKSHTLDNSFSALLIRTKIYIAPLIPQISQSILWTPSHTILRGNTRPMKNFLSKE